MLEPLVDAINRCRTVKTHQVHCITHPYSIRGARRPCCIDNSKKVLNMKFHLYECVSKRRDGEVRAYIVAPSHERAWITAVAHEDSLGFDKIDVSLTRVDETLDQDRKRGLNQLLRTAPVGFASYSPIGWIAHTAPVEQLKLFRLVDDDEDLFALAPNVDIAASVFTVALCRPTDGTRMLRIADGMREMPEDQVQNLPNLLEFGPIGIVEFDPATGWSHR